MWSRGPDLADLSHAMTASRFLDAHPYVVDGIADVGPDSGLDALRHDRNAGFAEDRIVIAGNNESDRPSSAIPPQPSFGSRNRPVGSPVLRNIVSRPRIGFGSYAFEHLGRVIEQPAVIDLRGRVGGFGDSPRQSCLAPKKRCTVWRSAMKFQKDFSPERTIAQSIRMSPHR